LIDAYIGFGVFFTTIAVFSVPFLLMETNFDKIRRKRASSKDWFRLSLACLGPFIAWLWPVILAMAVPAALFYGMLCLWRAYKVWLV